MCVYVCARVECMYACHMLAVRMFLFDLGPCSLDGCECAVIKWFQWLLEKLTVFDQ